MDSSKNPFYHVVQQNDKKIVANSPTRSCEAIAGTTKGARPKENYSIKKGSTLQLNLLIF